ncbi:hypothetical protein SAMN04489761_0825 [Tenacibaculum sp. MAR_2009_124]|uniref:hypothetical protein n=1 Tax=Tenacibaculum sp. MAR_2009_124 TaxID=1250059 RepID=UPI00089AFC33|nr:hypothetical protein [Tenacibaculum sp. MAR_2009_124]SEB45601.1 hypothetical protein SAMN04489761_0825 [Tenacibaculum sp. MAR_2009_124]
MLKTLLISVPFFFAANVAIAQKTLQTPLNYKIDNFNDDLKVQIDKFHKDIFFFPKSHDELHLFKPGAVIPYTLQLDCRTLNGIADPFFEKTNPNNQGLVFWESNRNNRTPEKPDSQNLNFEDSLLKKFGNHFFFEELGIPKEKYHHFITFCSHSNAEELYQNNKTFELIELLKKESILYHKPLK